MLEILDSVITKIEQNPADIQAILDSFINRTASEPLSMEKPPIRFTKEIPFPDDLELPAGDGKFLIDERFLCIGIEEAGIDFFIAVDTSEASFPVVTLDFIENPLDESADKQTGPVAEILEHIAPSLRTFLKCLAAVEKHYTIPLYQTPVCNEFEMQLKDELENILGQKISSTWWPGRLSEGENDYFWMQFREGTPKETYCEVVKAQIDQEESLFSLFSIVPFRREKGIKYFTVIQESRFVPILFDLLSETEDELFAKNLREAICSCRSEAVPYLKAALLSYPSSKGRTKAFELLEDLEYPSPVEPAPAKMESIPIHKLEWPPFDESDLSGIKYISLLLIFLGALLVGGMFYLMKHNILSMLFGASAVIVTSFFLPDFGVYLLVRKLKSYGYDQRLIDFEQLAKEVERGDVARCIDYTKDEIASSQGYLVYFKSELHKGDCRPHILLCGSEQYHDILIDWYETGKIPPDGPRSEMIKSFWRNSKSQASNNK